MKPITNQEEFEILLVEGIDQVVIGNINITEGIEFWNNMALRENENIVILN